MSEEILKQLSEILEQRKGADPESSYVAKLYSKGIDTILKKVGEEAAETIIAAKDGEKSQIIYETADLLFHVMVMLSHFDLSYEDITAELGRRFGVSGIEEKNSRKNR
ncbi:MAG: phosphoribosyl-ATP diphosphatase [Gammaproteobacteria bacterium]|nr:MAG: phosphoribosyl-ATP diphosphatase [Gammaproteobacteria bacterium]